MNNILDALFRIVYVIFMLTGSVTFLVVMLKYADWLWSVL